MITSASPSDWKSWFRCWKNGPCRPKTTSGDSRTISSSGGFTGAGQPRVPVSVKGVNKADLPQKICPVCQRPFRWRKKWERNWALVKYCSQRCGRQRREASAQTRLGP
ncbi:MAG: DUF2256 domain-containing protein [Ferruginibacter sp.]|nr:DUF2256 domain-containing protein [Cytophagales bacterium]